MEKGAGECYRGRLLFIHATILLAGGHYTYAEVPLGFWLRAAFGFARSSPPRGEEKM